MFLSSPDRGELLNPIFWFASPCFGSQMAMGVPKELPRLPIFSGTSYSSWGGNIQKIRPQLDWVKATKRRGSLFVCPNQDNLFELLPSLAAEISPPLGAITRVCCLCFLNPPFFSESHCCLEWPLWLRAIRGPDNSTKDYIRLSDEGTIRDLRIDPRIRIFLVMWV